MPNYVYKCTKPDCGESFTEQSSIAERDNTRVCPECGKEAKRAWSGNGVLPMAMLSGVADGHVPDKRRATFRDEREATKLEMSSYDMPPEKRGEIKREIRKLREVKK